MTMLDQIGNQATRKVGVDQELYLENGTTY